MSKRWSNSPGGPFIARLLRDEWGTAAALLGGLLLRAYFVLHHAQFGGDALVYGDLAHNLRLHHIFGFTQDDGIHPTLIRLPGYPLFLAACFALFGEGNYTAVLWVQVAIDLATCWLLSRLAQQLWVAHSSRASCAMSGEQDGWPVHLAYFARCTGGSGDKPSGGPFMPSHLGHEWGTIKSSVTTAGGPSIAPHAMGGDRAATLTLWLACLCPFTANYAAVPITECLTLFCTTLAFYSFERWINRRPASNLEGAVLHPRHHSPAKVGASAPEGTTVWTWPLILGLALAFAVLLRPDRGLLAAAMLPAMLWVSLRNPLRPFASLATSAFALLPVALTTAILLLPLTLWSVRNERVFHVFQPLAPRYANDPGEPVPLGFQRWYRTWAIDFQSTVDIYWTYDASPMRLETLPNRAFDSPQQRAATQALFNTYNQTTSATPELDAAFAALASDRIAAHPVRFYLWLPTARVLDMALRPRTELMRLPIDWWNFYSHPGASTFELAYALLNAAYLALAGFGLYRWSANNFRPMPPLAAAMLVFVALRLALLLTLDNSEPRYTLDLFLVLFLLAGQILSSPHSIQAQQNK